MGALKAGISALEGAEGGAPGAEVNAALHAELAMLYQRLGDARSASATYERTESLCRALPHEEETGRHRLLLASVLINEASLFLRERMFDHGLMKLEEAVTIVESVPEAAETQTRILLLGALHNRATIELAARRNGEAQATLERALEVGTGLVQSGVGQLHPQVIDIAGRLATVYRMSGRIDEALKVAERGARWAEASYEAGGALGPRLYVATQLQLVDLNYARGQFATAEDHLWKAVDVVEDPNTLLTASSFYLSLLRLDDAKLTEGGLPAEEVTEALGEVLTRIESKDPPEALRDILRARQRLLVDHDDEDAKEVLRSLELSDLSGQQVVQQLIPLLRSDVEWLATVKRSQ